MGKATVVLFATTVVFGATIVVLYQKAAEQRVENQALRERVAALDQQPAPSADPDVPVTEATQRRAS